MSAKNAKRRALAGKALKAGDYATGTCTGGLADGIVYLITDLLHTCVTKKIDIEAVPRKAQGHVEEETR